MTKPSPQQSLWLCCNILWEIQKTKAGTVVFGVLELLTQIINHCSWASHVNLSYAAIHARTVVQASIWQWIHDILKPFVKDLSAFFVLIQEIKAAIIGSATWNVMAIDNVEPQDLNIVVPNGLAYGIERMKALLSYLGTSITLDGSPGIIYKNCASRLVRLKQQPI